jgi:hypothetical protein
LLKPEWALLIARLLKADPEKLINGSLRILGKLIVVMAEQSLQIETATGAKAKDLLPCGQKVMPLPGSIMLH